jgi:hypothetical protein
LVLPPLIARDLLVRELSLLVAVPPSTTAWLLRVIAAPSKIAGVHTVDGLSDHAQASFEATPNGLALLDFCNSSRLELLNRTVPQLYKYVEA